ncbi:hypothetical protein MHI18_21060 [Peribacillus sp. FSL H8-0477]|uniref:hypothetical protein n=1 Tax=Peribacillus sp. FSL H8-0477 TaxID=2921388 RepID=UPI0030F96997
MAKELENRVLELENFVKTYYNVFLEARTNNENRRIDSSVQLFLYARANELLGEPNGKKLNE